MTPVKALIAQIEKRYSGAVDAKKTIISQLQRLKSEGIDYGTPSLKEKRYLRIVRPTQADGKREFVYIGADPKKQKAALDALERGRQYDKLTSELESIERSLTGMLQSLESTVSQFDWSQRGRL